MNRETKILAEHLRGSKFNLPPELWKKIDQEVKRGRIGAERINALDNLFTLMPFAQEYRFANISELQIDAQYLQMDYDIFTGDLMHYLLHMNRIWSGLQCLSSCILGCALRFDNDNKYKDCLRALIGELGPNNVRQWRKSYKVIMPNPNRPERYIRRRKPPRRYKKSKK